MKVPTRTLFDSYMRAIGLIIAGMVIGSAMFMSIYQHNFSILYKDNQRLLNENDEIRKELEPFLRKENNKITIRQIRVHVQSSNNSVILEDSVLSELQRGLQQDLESLRGASINSVTSSLLVAKGIINRKIYRLPGNKEYRLEISLIIIKNNELNVWSEVRPYIRND